MAVLCLRSAGKSSAHSSEGERIHPKVTRIIGDERRKDDFEGAVEGNFDVASHVAQHHRSVGRRLGTVHAHRTGAELLSIGAWLGHRNDGSSFRIAALAARHLLALRVDSL